MIRLAAMRGIIVLLCSVLAVFLMIPISCSSRDSGAKVEILLGITPLISVKADESGSPSISPVILKQTVEILKQRLSAVGYNDCEVKETGVGMLLVAVSFAAAPEKVEVAQLEKLLTRQGVLEFKEQKSVDSSNALEWSTAMDGSLIDRESVTLRTNRDMGTQEIAFSFNEKGKKLFEEVTARNKGKKLGIFLDGKLLTAPTVMEAIKDGKAVITGAYHNTESECREWAACLRQPPLPVQLIVKKTEIKALQR
ncbi:MAG: hypothetical protein AB2L14_11400 [Candidatus Xenobiia bacterium LiM19]